MNIANLPERTEYWAITVHGNQERIFFDVDQNERVVVSYPVLSALLGRSGYKFERQQPQYMVNVVEA